MSKRKNYYQVHKNKHPNRSIRTKEDSVKIMMRIITECQNLVNALTEVSRAMKRFRKEPIPRYKKGSFDNMAIVGDNSKQEIILDKNGVKMIPIGFTANDMHEASKRLRDSFPSINDLNVINNAGKSINTEPLRQMIASASYNGNNGYSEDYQEYLKRKAAN